MLFQRLRIGRRLAAGFALVLALLALTSGVAIWRLSSVASEAAEMMSDPLVKERLADESAPRAHVAFVRGAVGEGERIGRRMHRAATVSPGTAPGGSSRPGPVVSWFELPALRGLRSGSPN